ncbi:MAG: hypothetical protein J6B63_06050 [Treponema sp.]|nr:hypothetical protein [Treponema sp.]MBP3607667.1 hypothetical protein [Treponema sp.]
MFLTNLFTTQKKGISVYAFYGPSGTGKSFRAKLVAHKNRIKAIIDDGLLIYEENILAGRSAKLEKSYMGAVRVALFDDKEHRDDVAKALQKYNLKKILILGTSQKMVDKIAIRLQLPLPEKYIRIEDIATPKQIEQARRSRQIEGKHVIPVRAYEVKTASYSKIFVDRVRVALAKQGILKKFFKNVPTEPSANTKLFEKSVVRPAFSVIERKNVSQAYLARLTASKVLQFNEHIRLKKLSIKTNNSGYKFYITVDIPFGEQLIDISTKLKKYVIDGIEKVCGILVEDISIIIDKVLVIQTS